MPTALSAAAVKAKDPLVPEKARNVRLEKRRARRVPDIAPGVLQIGRQLPPDLLAPWARYPQLERAGGVGDVLLRLDAADIREEPCAGGEGVQHVFLGLQIFPDDKRPFF